MPSILSVGLALLALILLISALRVPTFLAFLLVSVCLSLAQGSGMAATMDAVQQGMGSTLGSIVPIILTGAWLGAVAARTGATTVLADAVVTRLGRQRLPLAFLLTGFLVGIPLFYAVGFFLLVPIALSAARSHRLHPLSIGIPLLASLSIAQGYLPPHPSSYYLVTHLPGADMGRTLGWGIVVSIPAMLVSGLLFGRYAAGVPAVPRNLEPEALPERAPATAAAFGVMLLPVLLIGLKSFAGDRLGAFPLLARTLEVAGEPVVALTLSVITAAAWLGLWNGHRWSKLQAWLHEAAKDIAPLVFTFAGAGALKEVLVRMRLGEELFAMLGETGIHPLVAGWSVAALIRIATGSSTVAGITTAGLILPILQASGTDPDMMVLAIGAGSMVMSHVNDSGFWLFKEYFGTSIRDTLRTWTVMETLVALTGLAGVLALDRILHG
jgi:Gnt-I system high-affinity gluconate transporter